MMGFTLTLGLMSGFSSGFSNPPKGVSDDSSEIKTAIQTKFINLNFKNITTGLQSYKNAPC